MSLTSAIRETFNGFKSLVIGMRITAREAAQPIITVQYPRETLKMPARFRGHIRLLLDPETGRPRCTACTLCMKACPSGCIVLDGVRREGEKKKSVSKYELDFTKCSLCGSCVEICPSEAIDFSKDYNVVSFNRDDFGHMDLYARMEKEAQAWASAHPQPAASAPSAPIADTSGPAAAPFMTAAPALVVERVSTPPASTPTSTSNPEGTSATP